MIYKVALILQLDLLTAKQLKQRRRGHALLQGLVSGAPVFRPRRIFFPIHSYGYAHVDHVAKAGCTTPDATHELQQFRLYSQCLSHQR